MNDRLTRVKWAGPNTPYIELASDNRRFYLNKRELMHLHKEIGEFVEYYKSDFSNTRISHIDENWENDGQP